MDSPEMENAPSANGVAGAQRVIGLVLAALVFWGASLSYAEEESVDSSAASTPAVEDVEEERRGFGLELGAGFLLHSQGMNANVREQLEDASNPGTFLPWEEVQGRVEPALAPGFTVEATVLSPALFSNKYAPSIFLHVGYENLLEDSFATFRAREGYSSSDTPNVTAEECEGGSDQSACDISTGLTTAIKEMWFLGVGIDLPTPIFEDRLRFRIALDYLGQKWENSEFEWERNTTLRLGERSRQRAEASFPGWTTHSLGVGASALVDVYQWKELQVRFFLDTRFSWILNDYERFYEVGNDFGNFQVHLGPEKFIAQAGGGIRIYWSPRW
ncbi:MAG: hypothetical protein VX252_16325 [Myxococcota bacterium]|nr:hypothetical protein [Myxococcota bacterium]